MESYTIDASGKVLGRVASEAAVALRGKRRPDFERHRLPSVRVNIVNASKIKLSETKRKSKIYYHYSGWPGGLKLRTLESLIEKKGYAEPLRLALKGMLPANKLRSRLLKNVTITN